MIKGKVKEERVSIEKPSFNYRKLDALNQSMLKTFDTDPVQFYNEFKLGKKRRSKSNNSLIIGDLVDFYLLECSGDEQEFENRFDEKFVLYQGKKGTGQVFQLADYLFEETENCLNEKGEITCSFMERFKAAYDRITQQDEKYKDSKSESGFKSMEKVLEDFEKNGREYLQLKMDNSDKTVVEISLVDKAKIVGNNILHDPFTKDVFAHDNEEYHTHFPIEWKYDLGNGKYVMCKSEIDMLLIDHEAKVIHPMDLKTTYDNESFDYMYIKNSYYLQNAFYHKAVSVWAADNEMADYRVMPMVFIVGDTSSNNRRPLIYRTSEEDVKWGMEGFFLRGTYYRGVKALVRDIAWAEENDEWRCSREAFDNKGQMTLNINYD